MLYEVITASARLDLIKRISVHVTTIKAQVHEMVETRKVLNQENDIRTKAVITSYSIHYTKLYESGFVISA